MRLSHRRDVLPVLFGVLADVLDDFVLHRNEVYLVDERAEGADVLGVLERQLRDGRLPDAH